VLAALLQRNANDLAGRVAVVSGEDRVTFEELADQVERLAGGLAANGVGRGDVVVLLLPNCLEYAVSLYALSALGAGALLLDPQSKGHELSLAFADAQPRAVVTDQKGLGRSLAVADELGQRIVAVSVGAAPSEARSFEALLDSGRRAELSGGRPDDILIHQYSSGSTGRPKRAVRTQAQCAAEAGIVTRTLGLTPDDAILCAVPMFHAYGLGDCFFATVGSGARLVYQPQVQPFVVKRQRTLELVEEERVSVLPVVPYMAELLASAPRDADVSSLRYCFTAGTGLPLDTFLAFEARMGVPVRQIYGCTESPSIAVNLDPDPRHTAHTVGRPFEDVRVRIVAEDGTDAPVGESGEIGVQSPVAAVGYRGQAQADLRTFRDGWVFPGDLGTLDAEGRLTVVGRTKIFIDVLGHKVDPLEVEDVLVGHPAVEEAVVVGDRIGADRAEVVKAAVVVAGECTERELIRYCKERLSPYKVPQVIEFRDAIPRSPIGKVLRKELIEWAGT
jgi:long-chain acyl-CoA synthetase